jgi:riboflavin-specific deaminase-like protein
MRRLLPEPVAEVSVEELAGSLRDGSEPPAERPRVISNFVLTLDGRATIDGSSGPIGSDQDTAMLIALRTQADAVMIGAGTMRNERYARILRDPAKREARERQGLSPNPLMVIVSGSLDLPWDAGVFTDSSCRIVIFTTSDRDPPETETAIDVVRHEGLVDMAAALRHLREEDGIGLLLSEGGPHVHAELIQAGLVDEMFVTHAPKLAGGEGPGLVSGLPETERRLELIWLVAEPETGELFARYRVLPVP